MTYSSLLVSAQVQQPVWSALVEPRQLVEVPEYLMLLSVCQNLTLYTAWQRWSFSRAPRTVIVDLLSVTRCYWIVIGSSCVIGIKEFLEPLNEFEVILKLSLDQFLHGYNLRKQISSIDTVVQRVTLFLSLSSLHTLSTCRARKVFCRSLKFCMFSCSNLAENFTFFSDRVPRRTEKSFACRFSNENH